MEQMKEFKWTAVDVWSALIEFDQRASKAVNIDSIVSQMSAIVGRPLSTTEDEALRQILNSADPVMWELRIAGPSEDERARVQGEILRILKPM